MILGQKYCSQLIYTIDGGWWEATYLTPLIDDSVVPPKVVQLIPESRNFSTTQLAEFHAQLNSVAGSQMITANEAKVVADNALKAEQTAHAATTASLNTANSSLTAEKAAHATTTTQLNASIAKLKALGIPFP